MQGNNGQPASDTPPTLSTGAGIRRRCLFFLVFLVSAGAGDLLFADYLRRTQMEGLKYVQLALFILLYTYLAFSFTVALFGFFSRFRHLKISRSIDGNGLEIDIPEELPPTAILFPVYNEDPARVMAGLRATWKSLEKTGKLRNFDFFILSDSRNPDRWVEEEIVWLNTCRELDAFGRIHYRHRRKNEHKKAGNISEFLRRWGRGYRYMVIYDADSLMSGECLVKLVALMEKNPRAGIIQTVPRIMRAETVFARTQQFASALYGPVFSAGLDYWQQDEGNYWGHNAILRVAPFMEYCALPDLPWREPLGGKILSHDFVEAALMRRAGYQVWLAHHLDGSYEEEPPNPVEAAERDRRWCQGNLQHTWLLFALGFHTVSRIHFLNGILSYANAFFWFWFLLVSTLVVMRFESSGLSLIATPAFFEWGSLSLMSHGLLVIALTFLMLFAPKIFAILDLLRDGERRRSFGGFWRAFFGAVTETVFSAFQAPVNMLWHASFVVTIPLGKSVAWNAQNRSSSEGLHLSDAIRCYWWQTLLGIGWMSLAWHYEFFFFAWISPVLLPMVFAIPFGMFAASPQSGRSLAKSGVWLTPEEREEPEILRLLKEEEAHTVRLAPTGPGPSRLLAVLDPYVNALHVTLESHQEEAHDEGGPAFFTAASRDELLRIDDALWRRLLASPKTLRDAHIRLWTGNNDIGHDEHRSPAAITGR